MTSSFRSFGLLVAPLALAALLGAGCGSTSTSGPGVDGGIYRTTDQAVTWKQLTSLNLGTKIGSIADVGTVTYALDPQDPAAFYVGTVMNGVLTSLDGGDSWAIPKGLSTGKINTIAVDAHDKCTIYAAKANQIFKTTTCGRDWSQIFFDPKVDKVVSGLSVDWFNQRIVYAVTNEGDIFRSDDAGGSWRVLTRINARINGIVMDPRDSRTVYLSTLGLGVVKTVDGGTTWTPITEPLDKFDNARRPTQIVLDPTVPNVIYNVSHYGLLRSDDGGNAWQALTLPNPANTVDIRAFAIHPRDSKQLVYATDTSIVFSNDGGKTWTPKKLPTVRGVAFLTFDRQNPPSLFLGVSPKPQQ